MSNARYVAAIDQGTTSTRCMLFDRAARVVCVAQREHRQIFPRAGWVEHDPVEIWLRTEEVIREAVTRAGVTRGDIAAVGITNQRETTLAWDRETGRPFHNAIVWQDTRTTDICRELRDRFGEDHFRATCGLPIADYFSLPKLLWLLRNVPDFAAAAASGRALVGTIDAWLLWKLTGKHVTDVTNASRTMMMDLRTLAWDQTLLDALKIPAGVLASIVPSSRSSRDEYVTARDGPFGDAIPVTGTLGDQQAALVGQACFDAGESKNTYGTGCFVLLNTGPAPVFSKHGLLTTVAYQLGESASATYALEGSIAVTGSLVQWVRDNLGLIKSSAEIETLARSVDDNGGVYFVPAFSGLFAPYWRSDARGTIVGMTRYTNRGHLARAVLEATAFQTRDVIEAMQKDSGVPLKALNVDGGMAVNDTLMQFQADLLAAPVVRPRITETTALGAAYAAGLAVGFWSNLHELRANWQEDRTFTPSMDSARRDKLYRNWHRAVERSLGWIETSSAAQSLQ
jgi:glycerol kinase